MSLNSIHNTISFIEENFYRSITTKELEEVSCYSYRNIQRIFKYTCGETIGEFQTRLKVENGYKRILYTQDKFTQIAYEVGFQSLAAFSKAFQKHFGITPKQARLEKDKLFQKNNIQPVQSESSVKPEICFLEEQTVYFQSTKTNYINHEIEQLWNTFLANDFPESGIQFFGIIADETLVTEKLKCRYDACCTVQPGNVKLPQKRILGKKYARFSHHGSYETIEDTYREIYAGWILSSSLEFDSSPIIEQYVKYDTNVESESDYLTFILIPLK